MAHSPYYAPDENENYTSEILKNEKTKSSTYSLAKVFFYMFIGLLITALVAVGLGIILNEVIYQSPEQGANMLLVLLVVSSIALVVFSFVIPLTAFRGKHNLTVPATIYAVLMGVVLSSFVAIGLPWQLLGLTFLVTSVIFGLMALLGLLTKGKLGGLVIVLFGIIMGVGMLYPLLFLLSLWIGDAFQEIYFFVGLLLFGVMMLITMVDVARIKNIAKHGEMNNNIALYCAFTLYNDFIYIFIRILYYLLLIFGRRSK